MTHNEAYCKCKGKKNKKLEPYIIKSPQFAFYYAKNIIKGRWIEAEKYIIKSPCYAYLYARYIIKGKLPENMHNAMLIYADDYAKEYFNYIKNKPQP
jgi:hypothetical protein